MKQLTESWAERMKNQELIILGDFNIHMNTNLYDDNMKTPYERTLNKLSNLIKFNIVENGGKI